MQALCWSDRLAMFPDPFAPFTRLGSEFQRGAEEVREQAELIGVKSFISFTILGSPKRS